MHHFNLVWMWFLLLSSASIAAMGDAVECSPVVSDHVQTILDNGTFFSTCAFQETGARTSVHSLFDVLNFSERDFLVFCRSSSCIRPVQLLLQTIPADCLIQYHGSTHNLSEEVATLYRQCADVVGEADLADEENLYRYFLDSQP